MNRMSTQGSPSSIASSSTSSLTETANLMANVSLFGQANSSKTAQDLSPFPESARGSIDPSSRATDVKVNRKPVDYHLVSNVPKPFRGNASEDRTYTCDASPLNEAPKLDNSEAVIDYNDKDAFSSLLISVFNFRKDAEKMFWRTSELEGRIRNCAYVGEGWELRPVMSRLNGKTVPEGCDVVSVIFIYVSACPNCAYGCFRLG